MSKERASKLDQYGATLLVMSDEKKTLDAMMAWLKEEGVSVAKSTLSEFLEKRRQQRAQESLLSSIVSGAEQCRAVESEFARNPAPELETLIKLHRTLILHLTTQAKGPGGDLGLLKLADGMTQTVLATISARTKADFKEREVALAERKAAEARKTEQEKALEFCLEEAREFPAVQKLFRDAFEALKTEKSGQKSTSALPR